MKFILFSFLLLIMSPISIAGDLNQAKQFFNTPGFDKMKLKYERCVLTKGVLFAKVSTPTEAITFAPKACKRELLEIKQFFLNSAFKKNVIEGLIASIKEGVEIDLVNKVYNERLKFLKN